MLLGIIMAVDEGMHSLVLNKLAEIEEKYGVKVLFAVESGSRAWGMHSPDSDYDVRFVYHHPTHRYLALNGVRKDVIEYKDDTFDLDMVGFDIYKYLRLLKSSNPTCIEWLYSPIRYIHPKRELYRCHLAEVMVEEKNDVALWHHYQSMGKQNYKKYVENNDAPLPKKYLYACRGIINALYVEQTQKIPDVDFETTLKGTDVSDAVRMEITKLIAQKKSQWELNKGRKIPVLDEFIKRELSARGPENLYVTKVDTTEFNRIIFDIHYNLTDVMYEHKL